jgi:lactoylglutathione lyase
MPDGAFPIVSVPDLPVARSFYERLGFEQTYQFPPEGDPAFVTLERAGCTIALGAGGDDDPERVSLWVYVDDVDATFQELVATGAPAVATPEDQPWGERIARTRAPDGTLVILGAPR